MIKNFTCLFYIWIVLAFSGFSSAEPKIEANFFNGKDLSGWKGEIEFWSVKDGIITGHSGKHVPNNKFLWSDVEVSDFYLSLDVRMPVDSRNAGIQFRSRPLPTKNMQAIGYQADAGKNVWGRLYHEHGRGKLDWTGRGEKAVKPGEWNRYEILAVGNRIWTSINGTLSVAINDLAGGEIRGHIALQIHSGQAQTIHYKINELVHNPKTKLAGLTKEQLHAAAKTIERKPNFVIIYTDDQGYGDLSCFGSKTIKTPYIDRMAKEGRKFTNFTMPTSLCTPSRAALLTGSYPKRVGMHEWVLFPQSRKGLDSGEHTIADQLKGQGYSTACFGKWHLGHHPETLPTKNGFDTYFGIPYSNDMNHPDNQGKPKMGLDGLDAQWKDPESTLTQWKTPLMEGEKIIEIPVDQRAITRRYSDKAIEFIKKNQEKPFFIYLAHSMPHVPLYVPDEFYDPDPKQAYIKTMEHLDAEVGRVLETLRETGLDQHTYVIFASDNGPAIGKRHHAGVTGGLRGGKTTTFEGGTRVPCVMWRPGSIPANTVCDELMTTLDVLPTIATLSNSKLPSNRKIDGLDASDLLTKADAKSPRSEMLYYDGHGRLEGLRETHWKLLIKKNGTTMLFNLADDIKEQNNLAKTNAGRIVEMTARMRELGDEVDANTRAPWEKDVSLPQAPALIDFDDPKATLPNVVDSESAKIVPSQIGGNAIQLDGRRTRLELSPTLNWQMDKEPFTISAWVKPDSIKKAGLLCSGGYGWRHGWLLDMHPNGSVRFETSNRNNQANGTVQSKGGQLKVGQWTHIAVAVHSNNWVDLFINDKLVAKEHFKGIDLANPEAKLVIGGIENSETHNFHGTIDQVKFVAGNALSPMEIENDYLPIRAKIQYPDTSPASRLKPDGKSATRTTPAQPFADGKFSLDQNDVVVFMGQTDLVRSRLDGTLEALLAKKFAAQKPRFRNMAWESDTVYDQWRDLDFGTWEDQLAAAGAHTVIAQFGQMEALDGVERLDEFIAAYDRLLNKVTTQTHRVVLLSPRPFEKPKSAQMRDNSEKNDVVKAYTEAIRKLAQRRKALFVDLNNQSTILTTNGLHLTPEAQPVIAQQIAKALGIDAAASSAVLKSAILEKNRLWFDSWRPMNWSFAFGDRTGQRFGQASADRPPLKIELEELRPILAQADGRVQQAALGKKIELPSPSITLPPAAGNGASPQEQMDAFKVADGFQINLFASEANGIVKPVQMRWDDRGRLWVICIPTYPHIAPGLRPGDYILVCEDTDGDGRADKFDRFAEDLFIPMGLEFGDGGVYVTEATELVHLKDTDGDGKADQRTVILSGFGTADSHQMVNGLERGPLGDLWFTQGHHAFSRVETPYGISRLERSGVWRYRPKTGKLDGFFNNSRAGLNCQGVTHDDWGQTFHNSGALSGGFYTTAGAIPALETKGYWPLHPNPSRNSGIEFIGTKHLPDHMQGDIVWGAFMSNSIEHRKLSDDGAGFQSEKLPDLVQSSRQEFRPVNARIGPDGAIYICDWFNLTIGHYQASYRDPKRDLSHGRIWRITAKDRPLVKASKFDGLNATQLLNLLRSPERLTRVNAKKRLFDLPTEEVIPATKKWFQSLEEKSPHLIYEISGIFSAHESPWPELVTTMIQLDEPRIRAIGTRLIGRWHSDLEKPLELLTRTAGDKHPRVRMETILACAEIASPQSLEVAALTLEHPTDRHLDYTFSLAIRTLRSTWLPALQKGEITFGDNPDHLAAILTKAGGGEAVDVVRKLAQSKEAGSLALLVKLGNPNDLAFALREGSDYPDVLKALLEKARLRNKKPNGDLNGPIRSILQNINPATSAHALALIGAWQLKDLASEVKAQLKDSSASEKTQLAALQAITALKDAEAESFLEKFATVGQSSALQTEAIRLLASVNATKAAVLTYYQLIPNLTEPKQITPILSALIQSPGRGAKLAKLIEQKPLNQAHLARIHQALGLTGQSCEPLQSALAKTRKMPNQVPAKYDEAYVKQLKTLVESSGDSARGKLAYTKAASCIGCHKIDGGGGDIGPDLTEVGAGRSTELLIESVLWPNRQIREGYMTTTLTTKDNQLHTGYKISEVDGIITLRDLATTNTKKILHAQVTVEKESGSAMIAGLTAGLTKEELADLIAYLASLKKK
ncbi:MAG: PVC-type heme-binding CxxCH protein [Akkermansiaceae bacterium]